MGFMHKLPPYAEFVPLSEAAAAAYQAVDHPQRLRAYEVPERRREVSIAIASLVPVYANAGDPRPLTFAEAEERIRDQSPDSILVHRIDLLRAVEKLKARH